MDETPAAPIDRADEAAGEHARWATEITLYEKETEQWTTRAKKILKRYKDERKPEDLQRRFNILWSNIQTLAPALYAKNPKPDIERRFKDKDDVGRFASQVLERATSYFVNTDVFGACMKQAVMDRLLPGRGTAWVRYVPHFKDAAVQGSEEVKGEGAQLTDDAEDEIPQEIDYEEVCPDYVHWEDFGHTIGRTWEEVRAVWRRVYLTRAELKERFGDELGAKVPLDYSPKSLSDENKQEAFKKAVIYEIWDKDNEKAIWLHKTFPEILDTRDDPLHLPDFFPCPRPMYPRLANDSLIPVPDYTQYQDQAQELDDLTARIAAITKALKVAGVYDASAQGVQRLLNEGTQNELIPVDQWAVHAENGGLKGVMDFLPIEAIMKALLGLYEARDKVKQDLYEISGIADIIRGATNPDETATAQKIKGQFATIRLDDMQSDVQRFAREMVRLTAQIIAEHFSLETIKQISGVHLMTAQEKEEFQQQQAMQAQQAAAQQTPPPQPGQPPQPPPAPPPIPEEMQELLSNPTWEDVEALLRNDAMRCFRIDIETDSTIKMDEDAERDARIQLITAVAGFLQQSAATPPELHPFLMQMLMFGIRGFKIGKELESTFEVALKKMEDAAAQPPAPSQDPTEAVNAEKQKGQLALQQKDVEMASKDIEHQKQMFGVEQQAAQTAQQAAADKTIAEVDKIVTRFEQKVGEAMAAGVATAQDLGALREEMMSAIQQAIPQPTAP